MRKLYKCVKISKSEYGNCHLTIGKIYTVSATDQMVWLSVLVDDSGERQMYLIKDFVEIKQIKSHLPDFL